MGGTSSAIPHMAGWVWAPPPPAEEPKGKQKEIQMHFFAGLLRAAFLCVLNQALEASLEFQLSF